MIMADDKSRPRSPVHLPRLARRTNPIGHRRSLAADVTDGLLKAIAFVIAILVFTMLCALRSLSPRSRIGARKLGPGPKDKLGSPDGHERSRQELDALLLQSRRLTQEMQ